MNRPARFTVADLRRAMKAAEQGGPGWRVDIQPDATISLVQGCAAPPAAAVEHLEPVEPRKGRVL